MKGGRLGIVILIAAVGIACVAEQPTSPAASAEPVTSTPGPALDQRPAPASRIDGQLINDLYRDLRPTGQQKGTPREIIEEVFRDSIPPDSIRPIYHPEIVPAREASFLRPDELVMGVEIAGESRAYPVRIMRVREMANDELGGVPILVSW